MYQVLARKWRPQVFEEVVGQEHITSVLMNSLDTGRLHHGYLFSGIRGIGKTTTARILAKALNCVQGPTSHPCNVCEFCKEIAEGYSMDVEEIDGASNRGVDDVRILQENTSYAPSRSRYKIFIIDEVHMLTTEAFNALLKTLEEPPPNVVFLMATTEPEKLPMTILSRCQQFKFQGSSADELMQLLQTLAQHEQITISEKSLALLVKTAGGSVRDAENLLDQVIGFCGNEVPDEDVRYVLGIPDQELLHSFLTAMFTHQASRMFSLMDTLISRGYNLRLFCMELLERLRNVIVLHVAKNPDPYLVVFDYTRDDLEAYLPQTDLSELQQLYWILAKVEQDIKFSPNPRYILEMALTKMAHVQPLESFESIYARLQEIQTVVEAHAPVKLETIPPETAPEKQDKSNVAASMPSRELLTMWDDILQILREKRPPLAAKIKHAIPVHLTEQELSVGFHQEAQLSKEYLERPKNSAILAETVQEYLGRPVRITTTIHNGAVSLQDMREQLEQNASAAVPRVDVPVRDVRRSSSSEQSAGKQQSYGKQQSSGKGNWQKRSQSSKYKPPVQVSVQDIVNMFEGEIEE